MKMLIVVLALASFARAQDSTTLTPSAQSVAADPSGFTSLIAQKVKDVNAGASIGVTDGKIGQADYLPLKTFHSTGGMEYAKIVLGAEFRAGEKARGLAGVTLNIPGIIDHLVFDNAWSHAHVTGANLPPIDVGLMPSVPLDYQALRAAKARDILSWARVIASVRFGEVIK